MFYFNIIFPCFIFINARLLVPLYDNCNGNCFLIFCYCIFLLIVFNKICRECIIDIIYIIIILTFFSSVYANNFESYNFVIFQIPIVLILMIVAEIYNEFRLVVNYIFYSTLILLFLLVKNGHFMLELVIPSFLGSIILIIIIATMMIIAAILSIAKDNLNF